MELCEEIQHHKEEQREVQKIVSVLQVNDKFRRK